MTWWDVLPHALVIAFLVGVPGAVALRLLGVRGLAALAAAPPVSVAGVGVLSVVLAPLGVPWRLPAVLGGLTALLALLAAGAWAVTRRRPVEDRPDVPGRRPAPLGRRGVVPVAAAVVAGFLLLAAPVVATLPAPDAPLQQWDAVFHLNAVVAVRETGVVTPLGGLAPLYGDGTLAPYYPTGWHALVAAAPGAPVPAATNVALLEIGRASCRGSVRRRLGWVLVTEEVGCQLRSSD